MVELLGQVVVVAQPVDRLAHGEVLGHRRDLALHQAAGGLLGVGERALDGVAVAPLQRLQHRLLLGLVEILDQIDHVVGFEVPDRAGQRLGAERGDDLLAQALVELGEHLAVEIAAQGLDDPGAVLRADLLEHVSQVGGVERLRQRHQHRPIAPLGRIEDRRDLAGAERVVAGVLECVVHGGPSLRSAHHKDEARPRNMGRGADCVRPRARLAGPACHPTPES